MPVYAFCGTLAAKVNLTKTIPSGEMRVWPEETARNVFPSGEKGVGPYENALNVVPYGERAVWPDETANR